MNEASKLIFNLKYISLYGFSKYWKGQTIQEASSEFVYFQDISLQIIKLIKSDSLLSQLKLNEMLMNQQISRYFDEDISIEKLIQQIKEILPEIYNTLVHIISLTASFAKYYEISTKKIEQIYKYSYTKITSFQKKSHITLNNLAKFKTVELSQIDVDEAYDNSISRNNAIDETLEEMRNSMHICTVCRMRPAMYLTLPCKHPNFCSLCIRDLSNAKTSYTHCYFCRKQVDSLPSFVFSNIPLLS